MISTVAIAGAASLSGPCLARRQLHHSRRPDRVVGVGDVCRNGVGDESMERGWLWQGGVRGPLQSAAAMAGMVRRG